MVPVATPYYGHVTSENAHPIRNHSQKQLELSYMLNKEVCVFCRQTNEFLNKIIFRMSDDSNEKADVYKHCSHT